MVWVSHLPQLTSNALVLALRAAGHDRVSLGSGGRDMTRLGASGAEMWKEILEHAPGALLDGALEGVVEALEDFRVRIREEDWDGLRAMMNESRAWVEEGT
jgi:prephenate dehydrogenase